MAAHQVAYQDAGVALWIKNAQMQKVAESLVESLVDWAKAAGAAQERLTRGWPRGTLLASARCLGAAGSGP